MSSRLSVYVHYFSSSFHHHRFSRRNNTNTDPLWHKESYKWREIKVSVIHNYFFWVYSLEVHMRIKADFLISHINNWRNRFLFYSKHSFNVCKQTTLPNVMTISANASSPPPTSDPTKVTIHYYVKDRKLLNYFDSISSVFFIYFFFCQFHAVMNF